MRNASETGMTEPEKRGLKTDLSREASHGEEKNLNNESLPFGIFGVNLYLFS